VVDLPTFWLMTECPHCSIDDNTPTSGSIEWLIESSTDHPNTDRHAQEDVEETAADDDIEEEEEESALDDDIEEEEELDDDIEEMAGVRGVA
jgi:hypothetical protein